MEDNKFTKEYQLWIDYGYEGWNYYEYDTLEECMAHTKYGNDWKISRRVDFKINIEE